MDYTLGNLKEILRKRLQDEEFDGDTLKIFLNESEILAKFKLLEIYFSTFSKSIDGET